MFARVTISRRFVSPPRANSLSAPSNLSPFSNRPYDRDNPWRARAIRNNFREPLFIASHITADAFYDPRKPRAIVVAAVPRNVTFEINSINIGENSFRENCIKKKKFRSFDVCVRKSHAMNIDRSNVSKKKKKEKLEISFLVSYLVVNY